jgi:hypothetical protein
LRRALLEHRTERPQPRAARGFVGWDDVEARHRRARVGR